MAHLVSKPAEFDSLHLRIITNIFEYKNDVKELEFQEQMSGNDLHIRSLLTKGSCRMEYPGTDLPSVTTTAPNAPVFPDSAVIGLQAFKMTLLDDNTQTQCVQPHPGYKITVDKDVRLTTGNTMSIAKGVMVFVFGDSYSINSDPQEGFHMFAVQNNDIVVSASSACRVVVFKAVLL